MKVYLAAMYSKMHDMRIVRTRMEHHGFEITATWIAGVEDSEAAGAQMDFDDIDRSDMVLVFTNPPKTPFTGGGRFVEMGYAIAKGKRVIVVGGLENVFCHLVPVHKTLEHFLAQEGR